MSDRADKVAVNVLVKRGASRVRLLVEQEVALIGANCWDQAMS